MELLWEIFCSVGKVIKGEKNKKEHGERSKSFRPEASASVAQVGWNAKMQQKSRFPSSPKHIWVGFWRSVL